MCIDQHWYLLAIVIGLLLLYQCNLQHCTKGNKTVEQNIAVPIGFQILKIFCIKGFSQLLIKNWHFKALCHAQFLILKSYLKKLAWQEQQQQEKPSTSWKNLSIKLTNISTIFWLLRCETSIHQENQSIHLNYSAPK